MFIGKEGEFQGGVILDDLQEKTEKSWLLMLVAERRDFVRYMEGLRCTLKHVHMIASIVGDSEENVRGKIEALGHNGVPAVLKAGEKSEMCEVAKALVGYVCSCKFTLTIAPSCV